MLEETQPKPVSEHLEDSQLIKNMIKWNIKFRMLGMPPEHAIKSIEVNPNQKVAELLQVIHEAYKINPLLKLQLLFKGKVLSEDLKFTHMDIFPEQDVITIMAVMTGG